MCRGYVPTGPHRPDFFPKKAALLPKLDHKLAFVTVHLRCSASRVLCYTPHEMWRGLRSSKTAARAAPPFLLAVLSHCTATSVRVGAFVSSMKFSEGKSPRKRKRTRLLRV